MEKIIFFLLIFSNLSYSQGLNKDLFIMDEKLKNTDGLSYVVHQDIVFSDSDYSTTLEYQVSKGSMYISSKENTILKSKEFICLIDHEHKTVYYEVFKSLENNNSKEYEDFVSNILNSEELNDINVLNKMELDFEKNGEIKRYTLKDCRDCGVKKYEVLFNEVTGFIMTLEIEYFPNFSIYDILKYNLKIDNLKEIQSLNLDTELQKVFTIKQGNLVLTPQYAEYKLIMQS